MSAEVRRALIRRELAATAHRSAVRKRMRPPLDESEMLVLAHLAERGGLRPSELARRLSLSSGGITACIQRLEADSCWIERRPHPTDHRSVILSLAPEAEAQAGRLYEPLARAIDRLVAQLTPEQRDTVVEFLERTTEITSRHAVRIRAAHEPRAWPPMVPALWG